MNVKFKFCLTSILTLFAFLFLTTTQAQIYTPSGTIQGSSGSLTNVGIGVSNPASMLGIRGVGSANWNIYSYRPATTSTTISVYANSQTPTSGSRSAYGVLGSTNSGNGYTYGVYGRSIRKTAIDIGRAYGVYGNGGNASINYGVFGILSGIQRGAAVFGTTAASNSSTAIFNGRWAGYFVGNVKMTTSLMIGGAASTDVPTGYSLAVDGKAIAEEVRVEMSNFWDEVFEEDYDLMTMEEKEAFTKEKKHLPSFAPEKEIVENGIELGSSYADMAKELEEAYQYIFELNKMVKELKVEVDKLK